MPNSYFGREEQAAPVGSEALPEPLRTLILNALAKVAKGTTTMEEVFRVHWPGEGNAQ